MFRNCANSPTTRNSGYAASPPASVETRSPQPVEALVLKRHDVCLYKLFVEREDASRRWKDVAVLLKKKSDETGRHVSGYPRIRPSRTRRRGPSRQVSTLQAVRGYGCIRGPPDACPPVYSGFFVISAAKVFHLLLAWRMYTFRPWCGLSWQCPWHFSAACNRFVLGVGLHGSPHGILRHCHGLSW